MPILKLDVELLESYEAELQRRVAIAHCRRSSTIVAPMSRREWLLAQMEQSFSGALQLTPMTAVLDRIAAS